MVDDKLETMSTICSSRETPAINGEKQNKVDSGGGLGATELWEPSTLLYQYQKESGQERSIIQEVILQRLIISLNVMSNSELQEHIEKYIESKENNSSLHLSSFLISTGKLSPSNIENLVMLRGLDGESLIKGYSVLRPLGEGGMATVYLAKKLDTGKNVAIKIFAPPISDVSTEIARFKQECALAMKLKNPYIVECYESGDCHGLYYLIMEFLDGMTLADRIEQMGYFSEKEALDIFAKILEGMWEAWNRSIIHRDIKPANIMIGDGYLKICDFGLAKALDQDEKITMTGVIMGTPQFMAPEQFSSSVVDYRADVYSLAVTLYTMVTGHLPFVGGSYIELSQAHLRDVPIHPSNIDIKISKPLTAFIYKLLSKKPEDRCQNPTDLMNNFRRVQMGKYPKGGVSYFRQRQKKRAITTIVTFSIILVLSSLVTWEYIKRQKQEEFDQKQASIEKEELALEKQREIEEKKLLEQQSKMAEQKKIQEKQILAQKKQAEEEMEKRRIELEKKQQREREKLFQEMLQEARTVLPELDWQVTHRHMTNIEEKFGLVEELSNLKLETKKLYNTEQKFFKGNENGVAFELKKLEPVITSKGIAIILQRWLERNTKNEAVLSLWLEFDGNITQYLPQAIAKSKEIWLQNAFIHMNGSKARKFLTILYSNTSQNTKKMAKYLLLLRTSLFSLKNIKTKPSIINKLSRIPESINYTAYNYLSLQEKNLLAIHFLNIINNNTDTTSLFIGKLLLKEKNEVLRKNVVLVLAKIKHKVSYQILQIALFQDPTIAIQVKAVQALAGHDQYTPLRKVLQKSESPVKVASVKAVLHKKNTETHALLIEALHNIDVEIRKIAAKNLVNFPDDTTIDELGVALNDDNADVRAFAAASLSDINTPKALDILIYAMKDSDSVISLKIFGENIAKTKRQEALFALLEMCTESRRFYKACEKPIVSFGPRAIPPLVEIFRDADPRDIRLLSDLFEQIGAASAPELSALLVKSREFFRQKVIVKTLGKIADPVAIPGLIDALGKSGLGNYARRALNDIHDKLAENDPRRSEISNALDNY